MQGHLDLMGSLIQAWGLWQTATIAIPLLKRTTLLSAQSEPGLKDQFIAQCMPKTFINSFLVLFPMISFIKKFSLSNTHFLILKVQKINKLNNRTAILSIMAEICSTIFLIVSLDHKATKLIPFHGTIRLITVTKYTFHMIWI